MSNPAQLQSRHVDHPGSVLERGSGFVDQFGLDPVHESAANASNRSPQQHNDRGRDDEADDGVGQWEAEHDADGTHDDGEGCEAVGARVHPVGNESC